jgi:hypothetical protein
VTPWVSYARSVRVRVVAPQPGSVSSIGRATSS